MSESDDFSRSLLEESKRFLEKAHIDDLEARKAYLHAALVLAFCSFEALVSCVADDFLTSSDLSVMDVSILSEREVRLENGEFLVSKGLKMYRLEDRYEFLIRRFSKISLDKSLPWWGILKVSLELRNRLVHPKSAVPVTSEAVESAIESILDATDYLYRAVYQRPFPPKGRSLDSTLLF